MIVRALKQWKNSYSGIPRNIWLLSLISLINRCGSLVIAFLTLYLTQERHLGIREAGYATAFFGLGSIVGSYTGGRLTDRFGSSPVQFVSLVLNGVVLVILYYITDFYQICTGIFIMALTGEAFRPANSVAIAANCTPETRTRSISLYRMSANMGWAVAPALGGLLVIFGWPYLFWVDGLTCIAAAVAVYLLFPPSAVPQKAEQEEVQQKAGLSPWRDKDFLWFCFLTMLNATVFMQLIWIIPVFWKESYGWSESLVGIMSAVNGLVVFLVEMPLVFRIEKLRTPLSFVRTGLFLYAISYWSILLPYDPILMASLFTVVISFGEVFVMPFSSNFVFGRSKGGFQGQYMSFYGIAYSIANTVAPLYGTQVAAAFGYPTLWVMLGCQAILVLFGFWWLEKRVSRRLNTASSPED
jgi:predicted MFS family arabinose efflux permease